MARDLLSPYSNYAIQRQKNATKYRDLLGDDNEQKATLGDIVVYSGASLLAGVGNVGEGIIDLVGAGVDMLAGDKEKAQARFLQNDVADWRESVREATHLDNGGVAGAVGNFAGDVFHGVGQSSVLLLDALVPYLGTTLFFTGIGSQGVSNAAAKTGKVGGKELAYGALSGLMEAGTEKLFGVGGQASRILTSAASSAGKSAGKSAAKTAGKSLNRVMVGNILKAMAGEGAEEGIAEVLDPRLQRLTGVDKNASTSVKEVLYSMGVGAVSGGLMVAPVTVASYKSNQHKGESVASEGRTAKVIEQARASVSTAGAAVAYADSNRHELEAKRKAERAARRAAKDGAQAAEAGTEGTGAQAAAAEASAAERDHREATDAYLLAHFGEDKTARGWRRVSKRTRAFGDALTKDLAVWDAMTEEQRQSAAGMALLGEISTNLDFFAINGVLDEHAEALRKLSDEQLAPFAEEINAVMAERKSEARYTVADIRADKDGVLSVLAGLWAVEEFGLEEESAEAETVARREADAGEAQGQGAGTGNATASIKHSLVYTERELDEKYGTINKDTTTRMHRNDTKAFFEKITDEYDLNPYVVQCIREDYQDFAPGSDLRRFALGYIGEFLYGQANIKDTGVAVYPIPAKAKENARILGRAYAQEMDAKRSPSGKNGKQTKVSSVREAIKYPTYTENEFLRNALTLQQMDSVKDLNGHELSDMQDGERIAARVMRFFDSMGNSVYSEEFGDVALTRSSVRSDLAHGLTRNKVTSFAAVPDVIREGVVIESQKRGNGNYERIVVAAPITIEQKPYYMAVMLQRDQQSQRLYLHDVITAEQKEIADIDTEHLSSTGTGTNESDLYVTSILQKALLVKSSDEKKSGDRKSDRAATQRVSDVQHSGDNSKSGDRTTAKDTSGSAKQGERTAKENEKPVYIAQTPKRKRGALPGAVHLQDGIRKNAIAGRKKATVDAAEVLAEVMGTEIYIYDSKAYRDSGHIPNGWIDERGDLHIDISAGMDGKSLGLFALGHESMHLLRDYNPAGFREIGDRIIELAEGRGVDVGEMIFKKIDELEARKRLDGMNTAQKFDRAYEEVVADSMETVLQDGRAVQEMVNLNPSFFQRLIAKIKEIIAGIRHAYAKAKPESEAGRMMADMVDSMEEIRDMYAVALAEAGERRRASVSRMNSENMHDTDSQTDGNVREAARGENFQKQLDDWMSGIMPKNGYFDIGQTPAPLLASGAKNLPLIMEEKVIYKFTTDYGHEISIEEIKNLPDELADPVMIFKGSINGSIVALTEMQDKAGNSVIVAIHMNRHQDRMLVNRVASIYGKNRVENYVDSNINAGNLLYASKEKAPVWFTSRGLQLPKLVQTITDADNSIPQTPPTVNPVGEKNSKKRYSDRAEAGERRRAVAGTDPQTDGNVREAERINFEGNVDESESKAIVRIIHENVEAISNESKFDVTYVGEASSYSKKSEYVQMVFDEQDNMAENPIIGRVELKKAGAKSTIAHGYGSVKLAAVRAIKAVIEGGHIISFVQNYKNTGVDRYIIAAKGNINGESAYIGVVVKSYPKNKSDSKFYLHEAEIIKADTPVMTAPQLSVDTVSASAYGNSIPQTPPTVNPVGEKNSKKRYSDRPDADTPAAITDESLFPAERRVTRTLTALVGEKSFVGKDRTFLEEYDKQLRKTWESRIEVRDLEARVDTYRAEIAAIRSEITRLTETRENEELRAELIRARKEESRALDEIKAERKLTRAKLKEAEGALRTMETSDRAEKILSNKKVVDTAHARVEAAKEKQKAAQGALREEHRARITAEGVLLREREKHKRYAVKRDAEALRAATTWQTYHAKAMTKGQKRYDALLARHDRAMTEQRKRYEKLKNTDAERFAKIKQDAKTQRENREKSAYIHGMEKTLRRHLRLLKNPTKNQNIPLEFQALAAKLGQVVNRSRTNAAKRIATLEEKIAAERARAKPDEAQIAIWERAINAISVKEILSEGYFKEVSAIYAQVEKSQDPAIFNTYDPELLARIDATAKLFAEKGTVDGMTLDEVRFVSQTVQMVNHAIVEGKAARLAKADARVSAYAASSKAEFDETARKKKRGRFASLAGEGQTFAVTEWWKGAYYNELKPVYFFDMLDSPTLQKLFDAIYAGEGVAMRDAEEARSFKLKMNEKYHTDTWDTDSVHEVRTGDGRVVKLRLGSMLTLYAYSGREQAAGHLERGGFEIDTSETADTRIKGKVTVPGAKTRALAHDPYKADRAVLEAVSAQLTSEQRGYVDEMVRFLSTVMGEKGNEVSRVLHGINLFVEEHYFPIVSDPNYLTRENREVGDPQLRNLGMTKSLVENASNPIILSDFDAVWSKHCADMANYHGLVLPMEDFNRVMNYMIRDSETGALKESVRASLVKAHGKQANDYINQLLIDLNGGYRQDNTAGLSSKLLSLMKKSRVMLSWSVTLQQPVAAVRAMTMIDPRHFLNKTPFKVGKEFTAQWELMKKYADTPVVKDIGQFDVGMGRRTADYINARAYKGAKAKGMAFLQDSAFRDEVFGLPPMMADKVAWMSIWGAVENEVAEKNSKLRRGSEEFYRAVGARFDEVVHMTQVYDSVLSKSAYMRSKNVFNQMATAFMAEPTTAINMLIRGARQFAKGNKKAGVRTMGVVYASMLLTAAVAALVYAMRDDDEGETYGEKYVESLSEQARPWIMFPNLVPYVRDAVSLFEGYDVERTDMTVVGDVVNAFRSMNSETKTGAEKLEAVAGSVGTLFGLPVRNVWRDIRGLVNTVSNAGNDMVPDLGYAFRKGFFGAKDSNGQRLYELRLSGDTDQYSRVAAGFETEAKANTAMRRALRDNDPRIAAAADARIAGNTKEAIRIREEIVAEGHFTNEEVLGAINSEVNAINRLEKEKEEAKS